MKKFKLLVCLCACVLGLSACGTTDEKVLSVETATELQSTTQTVITEFLSQIPAEDAEELAGYGAEYMEYVFSNYMGIQADGNAVLNGLKSWNSAREEIGDLQSIAGISAAYDEQGSDIIVTADIIGTKRSAQVEAIYEDNLYHTLSSVTTNVNYTFGEKMSKAGLNTLMGMGTVFAILILISFIISLFGYIPKIQEAFAKKDKAAKPEATADTAIAQIIEKEEQTDDLELIAVITAAIAASGTSGSADDFVVRSIRRKANSQWNKA